MRTQQMENQDLKEHRIKVEETIPTDENQPQEITVEQIEQSIPTALVVTTSPLATTVITTQRHRMITTAGHIR